MTRTEATLAQALADMKSRQGVSLGDLKPDEVVRLVHACERVANPFREVNADAAGFPVRVCKGVYFWRLTIGASVWLDEVEAMCGGDLTDERYTLALVYACINSRDPSAFEGLDTPKAVERTVKKAFRALAATPQEINAALDILFRQKPDDRKRDVGPAASDWADLCARLETQTGVSADVWMWKHSSSYTVKCYNDLHEFARIYSATPATSRRMLDELDEAVNALQLEKLRIMKRIGHGN